MGSLRQSEIDKSRPVSVRTRVMKPARTTLSFLSLAALAISSCLGTDAAAQSLVSAGNIQTFPAGTWPESLAFDGTNIWVSDMLGGTLTKLRASDGTLQG